MKRIGRHRTRELSARDGGSSPRVDDAESPVLAERLTDAKPTGAPLEASYRDVLESRLGHEFSHVRIHADGAADGLARDLEARAFAVGDEVFFRAGEFEPDTRAGLQLLAHESAHTAQQSGADATRVSLPPVDGGADVFEAEASRMGDAAIDASVPPPSALSAAPSAQVQRWPWSDDEKPAEGGGGGGSLWDSVASGASTAAGYAGSGAKAAYDGYQKSTDFHGLAGEMNKGVNWVEQSSAASNQKMVDESKGTWYEGLAKGSAWMNNATTSVTGGVVKGVGDLASGLAGGLAHPLDAAAGIEGILEHAGTGVPFLGTTLKAGHGLYDLAVNGGGQYGNSAGELANHLFNPLQQQEDDGKFLGGMAKGIIAPGDEKKGEGWQRWKDNPLEAAARMGTNIAPMLMGLGEGTAAEAAGEGVAAADTASAVADTAGATAATDTATADAAAAAAAEATGEGTAAAARPRYNVQILQNIAKSGAGNVEMWENMLQKGATGIGETGSSAASSLADMLNPMAESVPSPVARGGVPQTVNMPTVPMPTAPTVPGGALGVLEDALSPLAESVRPGPPVSPLAKSVNIPSIPGPGDFAKNLGLGRTPGNLGLPTTPTGSLDVAELLRKFGQNSKGLGGG